MTKICQISVLLMLMSGACLGTTGPIKASWDALRHEPAEWMLDAKFGIYTHWGVYSVPAFETED